MASATTLVRVAVLNQEKSMKILVSLNTGVKWPKDLFTELCHIAPSLFSENGATVHCRGQYLGISPEKPVVPALNNRAVIYRFAFPDAHATTESVARLKEALFKAATRIGLEHTTMKSVLEGDNGVAFALDAANKQAVIAYRDDL